MSYIFLIVIASVMLGVSVLGALYYLLYYADPLEQLRTLLPRILILISLVMVIFTPLLVPLDVSVAFLSPDLTFMDLVWQIFTGVNFALAFVVLPYAQFATEARVTNETTCVKSHFGAFWQTLVVVGAVAALSVTLWLTIGFADVPLRAMGGVYDTSDPDRARAGYFD